MSLRQMNLMLHEQPDGGLPVTLVPAGQVFVEFSGLRGAEGPCTVCQAGTLTWMHDKTQYSRMLDWTFDLPDGSTVDDIVAALEVLIQRHESLRTTYAQGDAPLQRVAGSGRLAVDLFEAEGPVPAGARGVGVLAGHMIQRLRTAGIDPTAELPMRVAVATASGVPRAAVAVFHHIAVDLGGMTLVGGQLICDQAPGDSRDLDAWRRQRVLTAGRRHQ